jgi:tripartite-type tricarboxylate transporter receptor subunit TctC
MRRLLCAFLLAATLPCTFEAHADPVADFYKGKQIQLIVGYGPGGGYDIYARLLARYFGAYMPGNPNVVVQNMVGAGSLVATNYVYGTAPKDGTVVGTFDSGLVLLALLGSPNVRFDSRKFNWLGSVSSYANDAYVLFARKDTGVQTAEDARRPGAPKLIVGVTAGGGKDMQIAILARDVLHLNMQIIPGYPDSNSTANALERGEVNAHLTELLPIEGARPNWFQPDGPIHMLMQLARTTRLPQLSDVPTARELAQDPTSLALVQLSEMSFQLSRPFVAAPDIPPDRATALKKAFTAAVRDPGFLTEAAKAKLEVSPIDGEAIVKLLDELASFPPDVLDKMKALQSAQ